ncbi:ribosomal L28e protein family-domain-containing protein [Armillaria novae-zelandiae]|uniref:Ribosomal L28e protein family-domain-containing protein n=1 Tax=Armillaria novae-zelandiae TaxID=153914 RepID=A0AA39NWM7_9AGAR|nr:ribosomal L28e protein family-domain-containing protein [Armillaria novae-zelandiae]
MSSDLQWLLIRNNSSFIVKRVPEGPIFSREPGNLRNLHSYKYSGLANAKTIDVSDSPAGVKITTRKPKASPHAVASAKASLPYPPTIGHTPCPRHRLAAREEGIQARPPLPLARVSALIAARKEPKPTPPKKLRGKKARGGLE